MNQKSNQNFEWRFPEESRSGINVSKGTIFRGSFDKENEGNAGSLDFPYTVSQNTLPKGIKFTLFLYPSEGTLKLVYMY